MGYLTGFCIICHIAQNLFVPYSYNETFYNFISSVITAQSQQKRNNRRVDAYERRIYEKISRW